MEKWQKGDSSFCILEGLVYQYLYFTINRTWQPSMLWASSKYRILYFTLFRCSLLCTHSLYRFVWSEHTPKAKKKGKWAYICMYHVAFYTLVCLQCKHCIACVECFCIFLLALARMWGGKGGGQMGREGCLWELERKGFNFCLHIKVHLWTLS